MFYVVEGVMLNKRVSLSKNKWYKRSFNVIYIK